MTRAPAPAAARPAVPPPAPERRPVPEHPEMELTMDLTPGKVPKVIVEMRNMAALHPSVEEAAMLYANGHDIPAEHVLKDAAHGINPKTHPLHADQLWAMLFDLYLCTGRREDFEACALDYVVKFEKSPPSWAPPVSIKEATGSSGVQTFTLTGNLATTSAGQLDQVQRVASRSGKVRVELGKLQGVDDAGCGLLNGLLNTLERSKVEVALISMDHLTKLLEARIESGKRTNREIWLLVMRIYQYQGKAEVFDEMAFQYAITFEESPPSWEARKQTVNIVPADPGPPDAFIMEGDALGGTSAFTGLHGYAMDHDDVVIDMTALRRMDFVSAGMLLNTLTELSAKGKNISIQGANAMVHSLLFILGINAVAKIQRRK